MRKRGGNSYDERMEWSMLSEREREIARGAALGYTNYGIASRLEILAKRSRST